jgi:hypothetical protein
MKKHATKERYVRLFYRMMETEAWRSLDGTAISIYLQLAKRYCGNNNGRIALSARQAAQAAHVSKDTAARAIATLQDRGFIVPITKGRFPFRLHATEYRLTEFRCDLTGQPASRDYEYWTTAAILPLRPAGRV